MIQWALGTSLCEMELVAGFEPVTCWLQSTDWKCIFNQVTIPFRRSETELYKSFMYYPPLMWARAGLKWAKFTCDIFSAKNIIRKLRKFSHCHECISIKNTAQRVSQRMMLLKVLCSSPGFLILWWSFTFFVYNYLSNRSMSFRSEQANRQHAQRFVRSKRTVKLSSEPWNKLGICQSSGMIISCRYFLFCLVTGLCRESHFTAESMNKS